MLIKLIMLMKTLWLLQGEHCIERHPVPVDVTLASLRIPQMTSFNKKHYRTNLAMCKAARYRNGGSGKSCSESVKYVKRMRKPQNSFCITEKVWLHFLCDNLPTTVFWTVRVPCPLFGSIRWLTVERDCTTISQTADHVNGWLASTCRIR